MRRLLSAALLVLAAACGNDSISGTGAFQGTYVLESVSGSRLPVSITPSQGSFRTDLLSDIIVLDRGNTWSESVQLREYSSSGSSYVRSTDDGGFYSISGNTLVLEYRDGSTDTGDISTNGTIVFSNGSGSSVFRRQ